MRQSNNITELRNELFGVFRALKSKRIKPNVANAMTATAGAMIRSAKLEMEYARHQGTRTQIKFLG